MNTYFRKLILI